jgi:hypothetical protein
MVRLRGTVRIRGASSVGTKVPQDNGLWQRAWLRQSPDRSRPPGCRCRRHRRVGTIVSPGRSTWRRWTVSTYSESAEVVGLSRLAFGWDASRWSLPRCGRCFRRLGGGGPGSGVGDLGRSRGPSGPPGSGGGRRWCCPEWWPVVDNPGPIEWRWRRVVRRSFLEVGGGGRSLGAGRVVAAGGLVLGASGSPVRVAIPASVSCGAEGAAAIHGELSPSSFH